MIGTPPLGRASGSMSHEELMEFARRYTDACALRRSARPSVSVSARIAKAPDGRRAPIIESAVTARKKWNELSPRTRRLVVVVSAVEGVLKIAALIDLARRPASAVRGSKAVWAISVSVVSSLGALPVAYFLWGRRKAVSS
jgi:hypothetical protein